VHCGTGSEEFIKKLTQSQPKQQIHMSRIIVKTVSHENLEAGGPMAGKDTSGSDTGNVKVTWAILQYIKIYLLVKEWRR
jgi:hypothetical protein